MDEAALVLTRHKLTVDDYHRMAEAGILGEDDRVELIDGEIIDMAPIGSGHGSSVMRRTQAIVLAALGRATVSVQNSVRLDRASEPQPDFAILRPRADFYASALPGPADVLLLIEVADSSLRFDRVVKLPLYARAGIPEVWIVDLQRSVLTAHRAPVAGHYTEVTTHGPGDRLSLAEAPEISLQMDQVFG